MPEELSWLPVIESGFMARALSRARALGMWQFIASTGYRYGLNRDQWVDERMDPEKATRAAVKFLNDLHSAFGDWSTALAAYNCGEFAVRKVINTQHINYLDDFWDLFARLPFETARFVPRFMAVVLIARNPEKYGFTLPAPYAPLKFETIKVGRAGQADGSVGRPGPGADRAGLPQPGAAVRFDPGAAYDLKVPLGWPTRLCRPSRPFPSMSRPEVSYSWHVIRSGRHALGHRPEIPDLDRHDPQAQRHQRNSLLLPGRGSKCPGKGGLPADY